MSVRCDCSDCVMVRETARDRIVDRLMTFGGIDRRHQVADHEEGSFFVNRENVLRLLDEELGAT